MDTRPDYPSPEHLTHVPSSRREPSHVSSQGKEAASVTHDIYNKGRTAKNLIPQGLIPDLGWNTDQQGPKRQPLPKEKQPEVAATQIMPTQVEGPPSSRLRSKTSKNNLPHKQDQQDPRERNRTIMDLPSTTHEVHQLHIIETTCNKMQVVLPIVLIGILLLTNVFFYFRL